jgi:hypothetical protein
MVIERAELASEIGLLIPGDRLIAEKYDLVAKHRSLDRIADIRR